MSAMVGDLRLQAVCKGMLEVETRGVCRDEAKRSDETVQRKTGQMTAEREGDAIRKLGGRRRQFCVGRDSWRGGLRSRSTMDWQGLAQEGGGDGAHGGAL